MIKLPQINRERILMLVSRYRLQFITLAALIGFVVVYESTRTGPAFPDWANDPDQTSAPGAPSRLARTTQPTTDPSANPEELSREALYAPDDPNVAAKYKVPANLSSDQLHQLTIDAESLPDIAQAHDQLYGEYNRIYTVLTDRQIKEVLFWRIKNRRGFKDPQLPHDWYEFSEAGAFAPIRALQTFYVDNRVSSMRYRVVGGNYTTGDVTFVSWAINSYVHDIPNLESWVKRARQLRTRLIGDNVLTPRSAGGDADLMLPDINRLVPDTRSKYGDAPADMEWPIADSNSNTGYLSAGTSEGEQDRAALNIARRNARANLTTESRQKLAVTLDRCAQAFSSELNRMKSDYDQKLANVGNMTDEINNALHNRRFSDPAAVRAMYTNVVTNNADFDGSRAEQITVRLNDFKGRDPAVDQYTVGEIEDIQAANVWLDKTLATYAEANKKIDALVLMLQNNSN